MDILYSELVTIIIKELTYESMVNLYMTSRRYNIMIKKVLENEGLEPIQLDINHQKKFRKQILYITSPKITPYRTIYPSKINRIHLRYRGYQIYYMKIKEDISESYVFGNGSIYLKRHKPIKVEPYIEAVKKGIDKRLNIKMLSAQVKQILNKP